MRKTFFLGKQVIILILLIFLCVSGFSGCGEMSKPKQYEKLISLLNSGDDGNEYKRIISDIKETDSEAQERAAAAWLEEETLGNVLKSLSELYSASDQMFIDVKDIRASIKSDLRYIINNFGESLERLYIDSNTAGNFYKEHPYADPQAPDSYQSDFSIDGQASEVGGGARKLYGDFARLYTYSKSPLLESIGDYSANSSNEVIFYMGKEFTRYADTEKINGGTDTKDYWIYKYDVFVFNGFGDIRSGVLSAEDLAELEKRSEKIEKKYQSSLSLMEDGKYQDAIKLFGDIEWYKDSAELVYECKYRDGIAMLKSGEFEEAIDFFKRFGIKNPGDYKETQSYLAYAQARDLQQKGFLADANNLYATLPDTFEDVSQQEELIEPYIKYCGVWELAELTKYSTSSGELKFKQRDYSTENVTFRTSVIIGDNGEPQLHVSQRWTGSSSSTENYSYSMQDGITFILLLSSEEGIISSEAQITGESMIQTVCTDDHWNGDKEVYKLIRIGG